MKTAVLQTRVDSALKRDADAFFSSVGMDTTTAIRIFLKQTLIQHKIPFEIRQDDSFYSEKNMRALEHSKKTNGKRTARNPRTCGGVNAQSGRWTDKNHPVQKPL